MLSYVFFKKSIGNFLSLAKIIFNTSFNLIACSKQIKVFCFSLLKVAKILFKILAPRLVVKVFGKYLFDLLFKFANCLQHDLKSSSFVNSILAPPSVALKNLPLSFLQINLLTSFYNHPKLNVSKPLLFLHKQFFLM